VLDIERLSFAQPWSLASFRREISLSFSRVMLAVMDEGGEAGTGIAGYLCRWLVAGESHILNIATHPDFRRHGVGTALMTAAVAEAHARKASLIILEVRRSNLEARRLYRKFGFEERRLRRNYYGPGEDALVMELMTG
jgi:[ribosomal protein S18]-alanine N-acetyltransferase